MSEQIVCWLGDFLIWHDLSELCCDFDSHFQHLSRDQIETVPVWLKSVIYAEIINFSTCALSRLINPNCVRLKSANLYILQLNRIHLQLASAARNKPMEIDGKLWKSFNQSGNIADWRHPRRSI